MQHGWGHERFPSPVLHGRKVGVAGPNFIALVTTDLSGTVGWAVDPADAATLFTDTAGTTPVTTPGVSTIARINAKFGTAPPNWQQATVASQYLWNGASMQLDGVDDLLASTAAMGFSNAVTGMGWTQRFRVASLAVADCLFSYSTATSTVIRWQLQVLTDGSLVLSLRRLDADIVQTFTTATGLIVAGNDYTVQVTINYLTGAITILLNGVSVLTPTLTGTDGTNGVSATNSARCRWGLNTSNTLNDWFNGKLGGAVYHPFLPNGTQLANAKGFVERNAL
jgi:hypothetical protein